MGTGSQTEPASEKDDILTSMPTVIGSRRYIAMLGVSAPCIYRS
jgi:hypothetical protein